MLLVYHFIVTTLLIVIVLCTLLVSGYNPSKYLVVLIVMGMYFFGVGIDIDHLNGSISRLMYCGMYTNSDVCYEKECGYLHRGWLHTAAVPLMLTLWFVAWVVHVVMDNGQ